jgi:hypothetical protein
MERKRFTEDLFSAKNTVKDAKVRTQGELLNGKGHALSGLQWHILHQKGK